MILYEQRKQGGAPMGIGIGISDSNRKAVVDILNRVLSNEFLLYTKTRNFHWNVVGPHFSQLHKFFESQYEELDDFMDDTAERARALGGRSLGSMAEFLKRSSLKESTGSNLNGDKMIAELLKDHEAVIRSLRQAVADCAEKYADVGTSDYLTGLMEKHEKMAWMLRSFAN